MDNRSNGNENQCQVTQGNGLHMCQIRQVSLYLTLDRQRLHTGNFHLLSVCSSVSKLFRFLTSSPEPFSQHGYNFAENIFE